MKTDRLIQSLESFPEILRGIVRTIDQEDARWRPEDGGWSALEIVTHLADEEERDFRPRLELTLDDPSQPWPPIDPEGWVQKEAYNDGIFDQVMVRFAQERQRSVAWLRELDVDWTRAYEHPSLGTIRAGDLLLSWVAHDSLHLRQLAHRRYLLAQRDGAPFTSDYAGPW